MVWRFVAEVLLCTFFTLSVLANDDGLRLCVTFASVFRIVRQYHKGHRRRLIKVSVFAFEIVYASLAALSVVNLYFYNSFLVQQLPSPSPHPYLSSVGPETFKWIREIRSCFCDSILGFLCLSGLPSRTSADSINGELTESVWRFSFPSVDPKNFEGARQF